MAGSCYTSEHSIHGRFMVESIGHNTVYYFISILLVNDNNNMVSLSLRDPSKLSSNFMILLLILPMHFYVRANRWHLISVRALNHKQPSELMSIETYIGYN